MQLKYLDPPIFSASSSKSTFAKITAMCWSNNNRRLAVADSERSIHLFDETGEKRERFPTKSAEGKKGSKLYTITGMVFSPDDVKLAIAQTDDIVYVYRLGLEWGEKKIICNKFLQKSAVTCTCWPHLHPSEIVFGLRDGRVRVGNTRNNKAATLYQAETEVVALAASNDGHGLVSGHLDGSIYRFYFEDSNGSEGFAGGNGDVDDVLGGGVLASSNIIGSQKICIHSSIPYCLSWGTNIIASGADRKVSFYSIDGSLLQNFDYSDAEEKEFSAVACNPSGQCCVVGSWNKIKVFNFNIHRNMWEEGEHMEIPNMYAVTSACWKPDGSRLVLGNMTGQVDWFDACIKRYRYKGEFEFTFVSSSQVIVKRLSTNVRIVLKSLFEEEILKVNVARDQYIIARTPRTLLLGDLESCKLSEIAWNSDEQNEKFYFDNPKVCMVYKAGEFSIIEYGINDIIGSFRTEHVSTFLISARIADKETPNNEIDLSGGNKKVAYLIDSHTICILDLVSSFTIAKINHDFKIDWLELNNRASKLLFRDKQRNLHVFDLKSQKTTTLLTYCSYVQWVPESDVVVAQNRSDLCVWYNIDSPDRVTIVQIKGEVVDIIRSDGCTAVLVDEGPGTVNYDLNEGLINFGNAMEDKKYEHAASILERLSLTPETEAMWKKLSEVVMEDRRYDIAERCFAALGDVSKARFLRKINQEAVRIRENEGEGLVEPLDHWKIRAEIAILSKDFKSAEHIYLEQAKVDEAIKMYEQLKKFEESIFLAIEKGIPNGQEKKQKYVEWLIQSKQEDKAAKIYEKEGQYTKAINLYLQGGFPASAANIVNKYNVIFDSASGDKLLDSIAEALSKNGLYEKAGEFYEKRGLKEKAVDAYRKGKSYRFAVELCRNSFPELVVKLEEEWGDYLVQQKQVESAIHHFIESNNYNKAIEAAITSRQWTKAVQILEGMDVQVAKKFYGRIARHYEDIQNLQQAKKLYLKANEHREAMDMFERYNKWDEVQSIAESYMNQSEMKKFYTELATKLEKKQRFKEAEKLFIKADETDLAINMYAKNHMFDDMIRLVAKYNPIHLKQAQLKIAEQLETEGHLGQAEQYYIEASDWKNAVNMYRNNDKWNDAIRVAKAHGGLTAWKKVAIEWAKQYTGGEAGVKLLSKLGLIEDAIDYAMDGEFWEIAFEMARSAGNNMSHKLPQIHMKYAISLEEAGNLKEAENEYINANSPKEAIDMYVHHTDWENAMRVAESHDSSLINYIIEFQADLAFQNREFEKAEKLYLEARNPEKLIEKYKAIHRFQDAKRIADTHLSTDYQRKLMSDWAEHMVDNQKEATRSTRSLDDDDDDEVSSNANDPAAPARMFAQSGQYAKAIDAYLGFAWKTVDPSYLEGEYINAVRIAMNNLQPRVTEVVNTVTKRLMELKRFQTAAEAFCLAKQFKQAIDVYVNQRMYSEALELAKQKAPDFIDYIKEQHKKSLKPTSEGTGTVDLLQQIEKLADAGDWEKCLELSQKHENPEILSRNTGHYINILINERHDHLAALSVLEKYGVPIEKQLVNTYKDLVSRIIWTTVHQENVDATNLKRCRDMLKSLVEGLKNSDIPIPPTILKLKQVCHIYTTKDVCKKLDLQELYAKNSVSLCRYTDEIPPDSVFYEAGKACEKMKWESMMFVFFNRFLDIGDAIEEIELKDEYQSQEPPILIKGSAELENSDFQGTDIPYKLPIPVSQLIDEDLKDEITNVVLQKSMNSDFSSSLAKCPCPSCNTPMYVANLSCTKCRTTFEPCVVTGYPVLPAQKVQCTNCRKPANRNDWNLFVLKHKRCPDCDDLQLTV